MTNDNKELLKADLDNGYTPLANLILEALAMAKMSGVQKGICMFLFRRTYGWGVKEDEITLKEFAQATDSSITYISKQLKQLIEWNVIIRTSYEPGKTPTYTFNTRIAQWDKGCLKVQGLNERIRQGLYKRTRVGLSKRTRVEHGSAIENIGLDGTPKESIKEIYKKNNTSTIVDEQAQVKIDDQKPTKTEKTIKKPKYSDDDKAIANYLKEKLQNQGVTVFPRDWHLKEYAVAHRILKKSNVFELKGCIDWLFEDEYWHDKTDSLLVVERQLPKYQLQKGGTLHVRGDPNRQDTFGNNPGDDNSKYDKLFSRKLG